MTPRRPAFALLCLFLLALLGACDDRTRSDALDSERHLRAGGLNRTYLVHRPASLARADAVAAMVVLHGRLGTAEGMAELSHLNRVADEKGFLAVYPQGTKRSWADARGAGPANEAGVDDVAFIGALLDEIIARDRVDPARVFVVGFSNGAAMAQTLACRIGHRLAGVATVAGPMPASLAKSCDPGRPLPTLQIHGTADPIIAYAGGLLGPEAERGEVLSAPGTAAFWRRLNGCVEPPDTSTVPDRVDDGTHVSVETGRGCQAPVVFSTVTGGGHTWPGGEQYLPATIIGLTSRQFDAGELAWDVLSRPA